MKKSELQQIIKEEIQNVLNEIDPVQRGFDAAMKKAGVEPSTGGSNTPRSREWFQGRKSYLTDPKLKNPYVREPNDGESRGELAKKAEQWTLGYAAARNQNPSLDKRDTTPDLSSYYAEKGSGGFTGD